MTKTRGRPKASGAKYIPTTSVGHLIRSRRQKLGLGLLDVATSLGVGVQFISNIEHGRAPLPMKYSYLLANTLKEDLVVVVDMIVADYKERTLKAVV